MLDQVQGHWKVDPVATKEEDSKTKKALANKSGPAARLVADLFTKLSKTWYEFRKDSFIVRIEDGSMEFTVVENNNDVIVIKKTTGGELLYIYKDGKNIILRDSKKGQPGEIPPIILMR